MELDLAFFTAAIPAVLISAASKGGFGGGAGFASAPLLALAMPPAQAVGLLLPLLMLMDLLSLPRLLAQVELAALGAPDGRWHTRHAARMVDFRQDQP